MTRTARTVAATFLAGIALAADAAVGAVPASAMPPPDPDYVVVWTQQVEFLRAELKQATSVGERKLIQQDIRQIRLDALQMPSS